MVAMAHLRLFALAAAVASTNAFVAPATPLPRAAVRRAPAAPQMGLVEFLQNFFASDVDAGPAAKSMAVDRLKVVLAHDRAGIDEKTMLKIREEIFTVLSKYVVLDEEAVNFDVTCAAARRPAAAPLAPSHPNPPSPPQERGPADAADGVVPAAAEEGGGGRRRADARAGGVGLPWVGFRVASKCFPSDIH